jgi:hypothetical protein
MRRWLKAIFRPSLTYQREAFGKLDRLNRKVDIKIRPIEMRSMGLFYPEQLPDRHIPKPWKLFEGEKQLSVID